MELEQGRQRSEKVSQDLSQVLEELRNARLDNHESKRQLQRKELLEKLSRLYPEAVVGEEAGLLTVGALGQVHVTVQCSLCSSMVAWLTCAAPSIRSTSSLSPRCLAAT